MKHTSCDGCKYDLGGGRDNCTENVAYECRDGGGFEHWTPKETIVAVYEECDDEKPQEEDFGGVDREYTEDCFMCGAKNGIKGWISGYNGHHRGVCSVCGIRFIE